MTIPLMLPTYEVGGVTLSAVDPAGVEWWVEKTDGWDNAPGDRLVQAARPNAHGVYDAPSYLDPRLITLEGTVVAPDRAAADDAAEAFAAVLTGGVTEPLTVTTPVRAYTLRVKRGGKPAVQRVSAVAWAYQLLLLAPDPRKYATAVSTPMGLPADPVIGLDFSPAGMAGADFTAGGYAGLDFGVPASLGRITISNTGTAATGVVFTLTGPLTGPVTITNQTTGQRLVYGGTVGTNDVLVIDTGRKSVRLNGVSRSLSAAQWWEIPRGSSVDVAWTHSAVSNPTAQLVATVASAWI